MVNSWHRTVRKDQICQKNGKIILWYACGTGRSDSSERVKCVGRTVRSDKLGQTCNLVPYHINILGILAGALSSSDGAPDGRVVGQSAMVPVHSPTHAAVYAYGKEPSGTPALRAHSSTRSFGFSIPK